jgi:hypothetical protein
MSTASLHIAGIRRASPTQQATKATPTAMHPQQLMPAVHRAHSGRRGHCIWRLTLDSYRRSIIDMTVRPLAQGKAGHRLVLIAYRDSMPYRGLP